MPLSVNKVQIIRCESSVDNFKSFNEIKQQTQQSSNIELSSSDYQIFKQDSSDGKWYVGLEYLGALYFA